MTRKPIFECTTEDEGKSLKLLEELYAAAEGKSRDREVPDDISYFSGSILKMTLNGNTLTVLWGDCLDESCWKSSFQAAFTERGGDLTVEHMNMDDLVNRDPASQD